MPTTYIAEFIIGVGKLVKLALPIVVGIALLVFFWGIIEHMRHPEKDDGRNRIVMGVVTLFVMISVWGIVAMLRALLGLDVYTPADPGVHNPIPQRICSTDSQGITICSTY